MGHLHIQRQFESRAEGFDRTLRIYTPDGYERDPDGRFPVLYMQDGQNVFEHPESAIYDTWRANRVVEELAAAGAIAPWIVVGIDSGPGRLEEYSAWEEPRAHKRGLGETYARFLSGELKPWVDRVYRTRPDSKWTAVAGSSLGGLISLYLGLSRPQQFGRVGAFSPSVMWGERAIFRDWRAHSRQWTRIYLDAGEHEHVEIDQVPLDYGPATRDFHAHLKALGYGDHELKLVLDPAGVHHERDWQRRFPDALRWLLG